MHEVFTQVLTNKDLPKAGDLFAVPSHSIVNDLTNVILKICDIASLPDYSRNDNDQSVVEICISKITTAIRETESIEQHAEALVSLLLICLNHNLRPTARGQDPPHAKIASDILSCIFLNYNRRNVMALALPVSVKFLHKGNWELSRNMSSYLSLAAIEAADLLAKHVQPIIDSVIAGNYCLSRVLLQIYEVEKGPIHNHVMTLVSLLPQCDINDKLGLLTLFTLVAKNKPTLLEPSVSQLVDCLTVGSTALATLQIFVELCSWNPSPFTEHIAKLKNVVETQPHCVASALIVIASVGKLSKERAKSSLDYISQHLKAVETNYLGSVLREVQWLCNQHPGLLNDSLMTSVLSCNERANSNARECIQQLENEFHEIRNMNVNHTPGGVTIVRVGAVTHTRSENMNIRNDLNLRSKDFPVLPYTGKIFQNNPNSAAPMSLFQPNTHAGALSKFTNKYQKHTDASRSTGRLINASNRSMPKLNSMTQSVGRLGSSSIQLDKSINKLNSTNVLRVNSRSVAGISQHGNLPQRPFSTHIQPSNSILGSYLGGTRFVGTGLGHISIPNSTGMPSSAILNAPFNVNTQVTSNVALNSANITSLSHNPNGFNDSSVPPNFGVAPSSLGYGPATSGHSPSSFDRNSKVLLTGSKSLLSSPREATDTSYIRPSKMLPKNPDNSCQRTEPTSRISVFEPYTMRDTVQHFCEKHLDKIKLYMQKVFVKLPLPVRCGIEERKNRTHAKLYFACQCKGQHCLYDKTFFNMKTKNPRPWIHLMFLALQARSSAALSTRESQVSSLKNCWDILKYDNKTFITLVTSAFPSAKDMDTLLLELRGERFFDVFEYNGAEQQWRCFLCNHPDRAKGFVEDNTPVIEGRLKEKKSKWKIFKNWRTKYFTLSGAHLSYRADTYTGIIPITKTIEVQQIRSVKVTRCNRSIPKAFEIFTDDASLVLKAKDSNNAEEWVKYLSIVVAHCQSKTEPNQTVPRNFSYGTSIQSFHQI